MITLKVRVLTSLKDRGIGLIGLTKPEHVFFKTRFGIHTFGMNFPIEVVILNKDDVVVKLVKGLAPNNFYFWSLKYDKVLELSEGTISKYKIKIGSKITLKMVK